MVEARITDRVNCSLHAVCIGVADHLIHGFLGEYRDSAGGRVVCVWATEECCSRTECAVAEHFQRSDFKAVCADAGHISSLNETF